MNTTDEKINNVLIKLAAKQLLTGSKLSALKIIKSRWNIGLKESKDILDKAYPKYHFTTGAQFISSKKLKKVKKKIKEGIIYHYSIK